MPRWVIPAAYVLVSFAAAQVIPRAEYAVQPAYGDEMSVSTAQVLLGAVSSGMMAFTAIVFSIAFLLVQYTATAYSKRFILLVAQKPFVYHAFGVFVATFTFALGTLAFVDRKGSSWVPLGSVIIVGALLLLSIVLLARLINRVADLRITRILTFVGDGGRETIRRMPTPASAGTGAALPRGTGSQVVVYSGNLKVVTSIDKPGLAALARNAEATIRLECAIGDTLFPGSILARVYGAREPIAERAIVRSLRLAAENPFVGDVRFSLRLLVDTAIMALSPAVNDPTTAVEALDQIEDLMRRLGRRQLDTGRIDDAQGELRLVYPVPAWSDYLALAFDEIRRYGGDSLQVVRRMRAALVNLDGMLENDERRTAVRDYRQRLDAEIEQRGFDAADRVTALGIDPQGLGLTRAPAE
jgi:uncharacterized membrane protein